VPSWLWFWWGVEGHRHHHRFIIQLHATDPWQEIVPWAERAILPCLVPALEAAPVPVTIIWRGPEDDPE
jgi:hypothetical protein